MVEHASDESLHVVFNVDEFLVDSLLIFDCQLAGRTGQEDLPQALQEEFGDDGLEHKCFCFVDDGLGVVSDEQWHLDSDFPVWQFVVVIFVDVAFCWRLFILLPHLYDFLN